MTVQLVIPIDDASLERARAAAAARGLTVEAYMGELIKTSLPPNQPGVKGDVSSVFGLVQEGEPTDIAKDKDNLVGEAVHREHLEETNQT
jgi:hypothetical protein